MQWKCTENTVEMQWKYNGNTVEMQWKYGGNTVEMQWKYGADAVLCTVERNLALMDLVIYIFLSVFKPYFSFAVKCISLHSGEKKCPVKRSCAVERAPALTVVCICFCFCICICICDCICIAFVHRTVERAPALTVVQLWWITPHTGHRILPLLYLSFCNLYFSQSANHISLFLCELYFSDSDASSDGSLPPAVATACYLIHRFLPLDFFPVFIIRSFQAFTDGMNWINHLL